MFHLSVGHIVNFTENTDTVMADMREVSPTVFHAVPRIWEKYYSAIVLKMADATWLKRTLYDIAIKIGTKYNNQVLSGNKVPLSLILQYKLAYFVVFRKLKKRLGFDRIRFGGSGAAPISQDVLRFFLSIGIPIREGYGMTETTAVSHSTPYNRPKSGSFGVPLPGVAAAIVDVDGTDFMPIGEVGELILNGPNIMQGYWKRPKETDESLVTIEGRKWLRTGDLVRMDEEGYFHFFDRKRDLIKYKGYSVFARHVEEVLYGHPQIKAAGVVGVPDPAAGQLIKAYVVLQSEARGKVSEEEIMEFCRQNMAHYKVPKIIEFRGELPKTDVGKVSRRELREEAEEI